MPAPEDRGVSADGEAVQMPKNRGERDNSDRSPGTDDLCGLGDVLLEREVGEDGIRSGLCSLFGLRPEQVAVVVGDEWPEEPCEEARVLCRVHRLGGDFPTLLSLSEVLSAGVPRIPSASRLCRLLGCRCLVDDGSVNPFTFLLVDHTGRARQVAVDVDGWDGNEYVIAPGWPRQQPCPRTTGTGSGKDDPR